VIIKNFIFKACCITGFFLSYLGYGQNQTVADSLVGVLKNNPEGLLTDSIIWQVAVNHTDLDSILYYSNNLIERNRPDSQYLWLFRGHIIKGNAYKRKGDLEDALSFFFTAETYARKMNNLAMVGGCFIAIGEVYTQNNNYKNAVLYYNRAIDILRDEKDSIALASALLNAGDNYFLHNELDSALIYFSESGEIFQLRNFEIGIAYNLGNVGLVYAKQGKHKLAEENINAATIILEKLNDRYPIAVYDTYMADIYLEKGDFSRALRYAKHSLQIGEEEGLKEQIREASLKLSELYGLIEDHKNAYKYQSQYIAYRDSINNEETIQNMADLRTEYEVSQKQIEVDLLEQQKRTQQIVGYAMVAVLVLIIALAIVLYRTGKQRQLANTLLARQKLTVEMQRDTVETQRDQLEGLNKTKDRFFSIISHDLRGPVNAFAGVAELIRYYVKDKAYDDLVEVTEHIDQSSSQLSALLDNLLNWAVSQQGEFPYAPERVNISEMTTELQGVFQNMSSAKKIKLAFDVESDITAFVDRNSTMTILRNLVGNALKFTESEGTITLSAEVADDQTIIKVQDTGVGIPKEKLSTLFQLLEKKSTWGTDGEKGLGLGLQLAYEFAAMNKGSIGVESEEGVGTTFTVVLPTTEL